MFTPEKFPVDWAKDRRLLGGGGEVTGCLKRGTQLHALARVKEIHLRAIGLEMEIYMDDVKEEDKTVRMYITHLLQKYKKHWGLTVLSGKWATKL